MKVALNKMHAEDTNHAVNPLIREAAEQILLEELNPAPETAEAGAKPLPAPPAPATPARPADKA